jgi:hypothetical protein
MYNICIRVLPYTDVVYRSFHTVKAPDPYGLGHLLIVGFELLDIIIMQSQEFVFVLEFPL